MRVDLDGILRGAESMAMHRLGVAARSAKKKEREGKKPHHEDVIRIERALYVHSEIRRAREAVQQLIDACWAAEEAQAEYISALIDAGPNGDGVKEALEARNKAAALRRAALEVFDA